MLRRLLLLILIVNGAKAVSQSDNYLEYNRRIIEAETFLSEKNFPESIRIYRELANAYDHVFLRDYKVAAQLAAYQGDTSNLHYFVKTGMRNGWDFKQIKKNPHLRKYSKYDFWKHLKRNRKSFAEQFNQSVDIPLRQEVKEMLRRDQWRALRVAITPGKKWKERYTTRKFVPNNRAQVRRILAITQQYGYPGEKIIGDKSWATVIISHNEHDSVYSQLRPRLYDALERGEIAPIELAIIETWRVEVDSEHRDKGFVIWSGAVTAEQAFLADSLRSGIGLRNINLNNKLISAERELRMNFYLSPFHGGVISVNE
jgi:hypothetical protein